MNTELVNYHGRRSGRTSSMLHRAIAAALSGESVMVVEANEKLCLMMMERTAEMEQPSAVNRSQRRLDYWKGSISFVVNTRDREHERGTLSWDNTWWIRRIWCKHEGVHMQGTSTKGWTVCAVCYSRNVPQCGGAERSCTDD